MFTFIDFGFGCMLYIYLFIKFMRGNQPKNLPDSHPLSSNLSKPTLTYAWAAANQNTETPLLSSPSDKYNSQQFYKRLIV